jgi:mannosyltransferase
VKEPKGKLIRPSDYEGENPKQNRSKATLLSLVRNSELEGMIDSMKDLEATWNHKFNYPWMFFNDEPFTAEFKRKTQAQTNAPCYYG